MTASEVLFLLFIVGPLVLWFAHLVWRGYHGEDSSLPQKPIPNRSSEPYPHPLEENQTRKPMLISISQEAWMVMDWLLNPYPGMAPVIYGYLLIAGLVRFRQRLRVVGSSISTFKILLEEFSTSELSSSAFRLLPPRQVQGERITKEVEISLPNDAWVFFDELTPMGRELFPLISPGILRGYFMYFGLWWFKELMVRSDNPASAMKHLLSEIQASGEIA